MQVRQGFRVIGMGVLVALAGCATAPVAPLPAAAAVAEAAAAQGDLVAAANEYQRLAGREHQQREHYLLLAAEAWRDEARFDDVRRVLALIKRKKLNPAQNFAYDLLAAEALIQQGQTAAAEVLLTVPMAQVPTAQRGRFLELQARALAANGKLLEAASTRMALVDELTLVEQADNEQQLRELLSRVPLADRRQALRKLAAADRERPWLEQSLRAQAEWPARAPLRAQTAVGTWQAGADGSLHAEGYLASGPIALLLPLSGEFAAAGGAVRDGFFAAYFADQPTAEPRPSVQVFDTGNDRESALRAVAMALDAGVEQIVGPLEKAQVDAVFASVKQGFKVLALNQTETRAVPPQGAFQAALAPEEEAAAAAEQLIDLGITRAAVLVSDEDWAQRASRAFAAQYAALGGELLGERRIAGNAVQLTAELDALLGPAQFVPAPVAATATPAADGKPVPQPKPGLLPVRHEDGPHALFVALRAAQGRTLMPQLHVRGQDWMPVLATSQVFAGVSNPATDRDLDGITFLDAPFVLDSSAAGFSRETLAETFASAQSSPRLFAFGIDAWRLLPFLDHLRAHPGSYLEGASGRWLADGFGRVRRLLNWYRFVDGRPQLSDPPAAAARARLALPPAANAVQ